MVPASSAAVHTRQLPGPRDGTVKSQNVPKHGTEKSQKAQHIRLHELRFNALIKQTPADVTGKRPTDDGIGVSYQLITEVKPRQQRHKVTFADKDVSVFQTSRCVQPTMSICYFLDQTSLLLLKD